MKEQAIAKINKIGKVSGIITLLCKILVGIGMGVMLLFTIYFLIDPDGITTFFHNDKVIVEVDTEKIGLGLNEDEAELFHEAIEKELMEENLNQEDGEILIRIADEKQFFAANSDKLLWASILILLMLALIMVTLFFAGALCKAFRDCQSPFEENVIHKMQSFAYALIPWTVASTVIESISQSILSDGMAITLNVNVGMILIVLIVFLLVYIFKYGAVLQQESDETL